MNPPSPLAAQRIEETILLLHGQKVMLDRDLALLYEVTTFSLNKAVKRNLDRFPADFKFQLSAAEAEDLRFHFGISSPGHGGRRYLPYAFTEQGVAIPRAPAAKEKEVADLVKKILAVKQRDPEADVTALAREIDELVYALYGLTPEESKIAEGAAK
jgi:hypothetical protein